MHILIAPNAFKNSLDATRVAKAIERGLKHSRLNCTMNVSQLPMAAMVRAASLWIIAKAL